MTMHCTYVAGMSYLTHCQSKKKRRTDGIVGVGAGVVSWDQSSCDRWDDGRGSGGGNKNEADQETKRERK